MQILVVEDNLGDLRLILEALKGSAVSVQVHSVLDGVEALAFLRQEGRYAGASRPDLVLLDLNLPRKNGQEVLTSIKIDPALRHLPVIIFTSSYAVEDISYAYGHGANCYLAKPSDLDEYFTLIQTCVEFWGRHVCLSFP